MADMPVTKSTFAQYLDEAGFVVAAVETDQGLLTFALTRHQAFEMARKLQEAAGKEPAPRH